ncbi:MAG: rhomboid family intramembrane serine protease [Bacteroidota bacterium]|nr:MAG: rhomboid family intramembrane serine protease [Bacteroidota bacterium]
MSLAEDIDKRRLLVSMVFPLLFVALLWVVKLIETLSDTSFVQLGLYPLKAKGLPGIVFGPLLHGDWKHLFNNTFSLFFLSWAVFYFYHKVAWKAFFLIYFISQFWLWFFAREAYHIGASGLIYGYGSFVFVSGILLKHRHLLAISLLVAFLYGSMVWGILPVDEKVSWEGHLMGLIAGIILAVYYKDSGPVLPTQENDLEDEESDFEFEEYQEGEEKAS